MTPVLCFDCMARGSAALLAAIKREHPERGARRVSVRGVVRHAALLTGLGEEVITGKRRFRAIANVRRAIVLVVCEHRRHSYPEIGQALGGLDHSTVIHARKTGEALLERDPEFAKLVAELREATRAEPFGPGEDGGIVVVDAPLPVPGISEKMAKWQAESAAPSGVSAFVAPMPQPVPTRSEPGEYTPRHALPAVMAVPNPADAEPLAAPRDSGFEAMLVRGSARLLAALRRANPTLGAAA